MSHCRTCRTFAGLAACLALFALVAILGCGGESNEVTQAEPDNGSSGPPPTGHLADNSDDDEDFQNEPDGEDDGGEPDDGEGFESEPSGLGQGVGLEADAGARGESGLAGPPEGPAGADSSTGGEADANTGGANVGEAGQLSAGGGELDAGGGELAAGGGEADVTKRPGKTPNVKLPYSADKPPAFGFEVGQIAPEIHGQDVDGETFRLSDYRGKVVMLDFWGDW